MVHSCNLVRCLTIANSKSRNLFLVKEAAHVLIDSQCCELAMHITVEYILSIDEHKAQLVYTTN